MFKSLQSLLCLLSHFVLGHLLHAELFFVVFYYLLILQPVLLLDPFQSLFLHPHDSS
jgi:hypothetical protein